MKSERLIQLRKEYKLTQQQLASKLKITRSALSLYELGKRYPDTKILSGIASFFNVSADYLIGISDIRNPYDQEFPKKASHIIDVSILPDEAIKQAEEYIEFLKQKYSKK